MVKRQGHFLLVKPGQIPCAEVVQLHEQCGAFMQCHGFPVASAERTFQGPQQVEAGLLASLAHGHKGGHGAQRTQCCGVQMPAAWSMRSDAGPRLGKARSGGSSGGLAVMGCMMAARGNHRKPPHSEYIGRPDHNPQQQMRG